MILSLLVILSVSIDDVSAETGNTSEQTDYESFIQLYNENPWTIVDVQSLAYPEAVSSANYHPIIKAVFDEFFQIIKQDNYYQSSHALRTLLSHTYVIQTMQPTFSEQENDAIDLLIAHIYFANQVFYQAVIDERIANQSNYPVPNQTANQFWMDRTEAFSVLKDTDPTQYDHLLRMSIASGMDPRVYHIEARENDFYTFHHNEGIYEGPSMIFRYNTDTQQIETMNPYDESISIYDYNFDFSKVYGIAVANDYQTEIDIPTEPSVSESYNQDGFQVMDAMELIELADEHNMVYLDPQYAWSKNQLEQLLPVDAIFDSELQPIIYALYNRFFTNIVANYRTATYGQIYQETTTLLSHTYIIEHIVPQLSADELAALDNLQAYLFFAIDLFEVDRINDPQSEGQDGGFGVHIPLMIQMRTLIEEFEQLKISDPVEADTQLRIGLASGYMPQVYRYSKEHNHNAEYLIEKVGYHLIGDLAWLYNYDEENDIVQQYNPYGDINEPIDNVFDFMSNYKVKIDY